MVNLVVSSARYNKFVNVIFFVDTGCPSLYVSEQAMKALGYSDNIPNSFQMNFSDQNFTAHISPLVTSNGTPGHFKDVNVLGASFLRQIRSTLTLDYVKLTFTIKMKV